MRGIRGASQADATAAFKDVENPQSCYAFRASITGFIIPATNVYFGGHYVFRNCVITVLLCYCGFANLTLAGEGIKDFKPVTDEMLENPQ